MFEGAPASYDRFMGVYSVQLAPQLADLAGVRSGQHVLDVGCGPGALTSELVAQARAEDELLTAEHATAHYRPDADWVLRRKAPEALDSAVEVSGLRLDPATRRVTRGNQEVKIGPTEFRLLHFFMTHTERVHSRTQLLDRVWGDHVFIEERTVDVHVKRLREALAPVQCSSLIETVRGAGYRLTQQAAATSV